MPNASTHVIAGGITGAITAELLQDEVDAGGAELVTGAVVGAVAGRAPDILEPAIHPGHREFFHSWSVGFLVGYELYRAYRWQPPDELGRGLRWLALVGGTAYLTHLALDAGTTKGLPVV